MKDIFKNLWKEIEDISSLFSSNLLGKKDHGHHSSFGRTSDHISPKGNGLSLTGNRYLDLASSYQHAIAVAPTGAGKTVSLIVPSLLNADRSGASYVVNDNSGELLELTGNYFRFLGYKVISLDFSKKIFNSSTNFYNPLANVSSKTDLAKIVQMLVQNSSSKLEFWELKSIECISLCADVLFTMDKQFHNLSNLYCLLQSLAGDENKVNQLMVTQSESLFLRYKGLLANSENTKASIISSAISALSFVDNNPTIGFLTSKDSNIFSTLRSEKTVVFLRVPVADQSLFTPITNIFWEQLFSSILRSDPPKKGDGTIPLLCIMDELGSTKIPGGFASSYLPNLRKWYCGVLGILQSTEQLHEHYGKFAANSLLNNVNQVYFSGLSYEARSISDRLGSYTYEEGTGDHKRNQTRLLLTPTEVSNMPADKVIIFPNKGGIQPLYESIVPYFKQPHLLRKTKMIIPEKEGTPPPIDQHIPLFNFPSTPQI